MNILPSTPATDGFMTRQRFGQIKPGTILLDLAAARLMTKRRFLMP